MISFIRGGTELLRFRRCNGIFTATSLCRIISCLEARKRLPPWVQFYSVVALCQWEALCSPVSRTILHSAPHFSSACFALRLRPQNNLK
jgi:hypothetical protein